jgi:hypothetical protein
MSEKGILEILRGFYSDRWIAIQEFFSKWKGTIKDWIIFLILVFGLAMISISFNVVLNAEALKTLVQAEVTFFGFFGVLLVYVLKQYDDKLQDWKETADKLTPSESIEAIPLLSTTQGEQIINIINEIRENKMAFVNTGITIGAVITFSMLMSVWLIGSFESTLNLNSSLTGVILTLGYLAIGLFLIAIYMFLQLFRKMAKEI